MTNEKKSYDVGYKKPPKDTRFKSGQSGNPKGRPKGARNLKTELRAELHERIAVLEAGRSLKISKQRAVLKAMTAKALQGDARAATVILNLVLRLFQDEDGQSPIVDLTKADQDILKAFERDILKSAKRKVQDND